MRGGRRKHPDLMALEGGRGRKKASPANPEPMTKKTWVTPRWLPKYAKEFVKRYRGPLERSNVLTSWDYDSFLVIACLASEIRDHIQVLAKEGYTIEGRQKGLVKHPRVSMLRAATQQFRLYAGSFGLTPRGRCGLDVRPIEDDEDDLLAGATMRHLID